MYAHDLRLHTRTYLLLSGSDADQLRPSLCTLKSTLEPRTTWFRLGKSPVPNTHIQRPPRRTQRLRHRHVCHHHNEYDLRLTRTLLNQLPRLPFIQHIEDRSTEVRPSCLRDLTEVRPVGLSVTCVDYEGGHDLSPGASRVLSPFTPMFTLS